MGEEVPKQHLEGEEVEILTICYEKPGTTEEIASELNKEVTEIEAVLKSLKAKKLITESGGSWQTTDQGDFYIENDKNPTDD